MFSAFGSDLTALIDEVVTEHNNTGVLPVADKLNPASYTIDGTHFMWFVDMWYGWFEADRIKEVADMTF